MAKDSGIANRSLGEKIFLLSLSMLIAVILTFGLEKNVFLLSFYIIPIILAANYYGLVGGIGFAAVSAVLALSLAKSSGILLDNAEVIAQIILYFLVGGFGGFMQRESAQMKQALQVASVTDELTGLYNYHHFRQRLDEEIKRAARYRHPIALMMCDIDNFKKYNDTFGHPNGNFVLNKIAVLIRESIRESDIPFRYGGDEFVVLLPETGALGGEVAKRVIESVNSAFATKNIDSAIKPSLSAGIALSNPSSPLSSSQIIVMADQALYEAKRSGKKVIVLAPDADRPA